MKHTKFKKMKFPFSGQKTYAAAKAIPSGNADAAVELGKTDTFKHMLADESKLEQLQASQMTLNAIRGGDVDALMIAGQVFALKDADHAYRKIVEQMQEGYLTAVDGRIISCNHYFAAMVGSSPQQVIGKPLIDYVAEEDRKQFSQLTTESRSRKCRARIHFISNGKKVPGCISAVLLAVKGMETLCYVVTDMSLQSSHEKIKVTLKKKTSLLEKMSRMNEELKSSEQKLEESAYELILANIKLKKLDETKNIFMAMASHELRSPLCVVKMYADLLSAQNSSPEELKERLSAIGNNAGRMQRLIASLLDISKIDLGEMPMNLNVQTDLNQILKNCIAANTAAAEKKSISIHNTLNGVPSRVLGDEDRLHQVFENLISNALKYTPRGGKIGIESKKINKKIEVTVRDSGIGIEPKDLDKIFEPFQKLRSSGLEGEVSTGLGLTLVKKIVEVHGGTVEVHSEVGKGSAFTVSLPQEI